MTSEKIKSKVNQLLIVLGSPNDENGRLGKIALSRLNLCLKTYHKNDLILCTGGWGPNFNTAPEPHAFYAKKFLMSKGIPASVFVDMALSANSVEDAVKAKTISDRQEHSLIKIITSDFHLDRVKLIFNEVFKNQALYYLGADSSFLKKELKLVKLHEQKAIQSIKKNGLYY